jgi:cytochrome o ubiquinol oxidase subunit 2
MVNLGVLSPHGIIASDERLLLITAVGLMLFVVIPVIILSIVFAWKYRASNTKAKYSPEFAHSTFLELIWWTIPIIIIAILAVITWTTSHRYDPYRPLDIKTKPIIIQVIALNWKWLFIYPEQNIATVNFRPMFLLDFLLPPMHQ